MHCGRYEVLLIGHIEFSAPKNEIPLLQLQEKKKVDYRFHCITNKGFQCFVYIFLFGVGFFYIKAHTDWQLKVKFLCVLPQFYLLFPKQGLSERKRGKTRPEFLSKINPLIYINFRKQQFSLHYSF